MTDGVNAPDGRTSLDAAVIVAHPDDETLWAGGTVLMHPEWRWGVVVLCRGSDADRAPRFERVMRRLHASGLMADLDDGPEQTPLEPSLVQGTIRSLVAGRRFDLVLTHSPRGEYTRHRRHEETGAAVLTLWESGLVSTRRLWMFAYEDGGGSHLPRAIESADEVVRLPEEVWLEKRALVTDIYGFSPGSFEARTTPRVEAFWSFGSPAEAQRRLRNEGDRS